MRQLGHDPPRAAPQENLATAPVSLRRHREHRRPVGSAARRSEADVSVGAVVEEVGGVEGSF